MRAAAGRTMGRTFGAIREAWLDMALAGGVGYIVPSYLSKLGFGYLAYNNIPMYHTAVDQLYQASDSAGLTGDANPWREGGLTGIGKTYGVLDASKQVLTAAKHGGFSRGALVKSAFDLGLVFDGPGDNYGGGGGGPYW